VAHQTLLLEDRGHLLTEIVLLCGGRAPGANRKGQNNKDYNQNLANVIRTGIHAHLIYLLPEIIADWRTLLFEQQKVNNFLINACFKYRNKVTLWIPLQFPSDFSE
jgi:hypothetical protein